MTVGVTGTTLSVPAITSDVVDKGLVLVYFSASGTAPWYALPFTNGPTTISVQSYTIGQVVVTASTTVTGLYFKVVVVPGTSITTLNYLRHSVNLNDYGAVATALRIK
jgi:hypothetical protein